MRGGSFIVESESAPGHHVHGAILEAHHRRCHPDAYDALAVWPTHGVALFPDQLITSEAVTEVGVSHGLTLTLRYSDIAF